MNNVNEEIIEKMIDALASFYTHKNDDMYEDDEEESKGMKAYREHASTIINVDCKNDFYGLKAVIKIELHKAEQLKNDLKNLAALVEAYQIE